MSTIHGLKNARNFYKISKQTAPKVKFIVHHEIFVCR